MKILNRWTLSILFESEHETMKETVEAAIAAAADLSAADLSAADLRRADLRRADLSAADLRRADLRRADLSAANLRCADLSAADLRRANLSDADLSDADLSAADLPEIDKFEGLRGAICARVCATPENLEMSTWHACDTTHCLAGWATVIHPQGRLLESIYGTSVAAAMIFHVCEGEVPDFHSSNEEAMNWLRKEKEQ